MSLLELPSDVIHVIYEYLDCLSLWNLSRTHSRFSSLRASHDINVLSLWKNACKKYSPSIGQYNILKSWFEVGFEDPVNYRTAFLSFQRKEFCKLFDELAKSAAEYENSSKFGETPYGQGCKTSVWLGEAKVYQVECTHCNTASKTYLVSFRFTIVSRSFIASGSGGAPHITKYLGSLCIELPRKWVVINRQGRLFKSYNYFNYKDYKWNEQEDEDPVNDLEYLIEKEFERRKEWKPAKNPHLTVVVLGSPNSGKTSYIHKLVLNKVPKFKWPFEQSYSKCYISNTEFHIEFFDPAEDTFFYTFPDELFFQKGSRHANLAAHVHYRRANCFFIMLVDVTSTTSLTSARECFRRQLGRSFKNQCVMVLANKTDSPDRKVTSEAIDSLAKEHGAVFFEVSALTGTNVEDSFQTFLEQAVPRAIEEKAAREEALNRRAMQTDSASYCSMM